MPYYRGEDPEPPTSEEVGAFARAILYLFGFFVVAIFLVSLFIPAQRPSDATLIIFNPRPQVVTAKVYNEGESKPQFEWSCSKGANTVGVFAQDERYRVEFWTPWGDRLNTSTFYLSRPGSSVRVVVDDLKPGEFRR